MNAPPTNNEFKLKFINCFEENHQENYIIGLCIDQKCNIENKFLCNECVFENHPCHKGIKSKEIEEIINKNIKENKNLIEIFNQKYNEFKKMIRNKIVEFKIKMNNILKNIMIIL